MVRIKATCLVRTRDLVTFDFSASDDSEEVEARSRLLFHLRTRQPIITTVQIERQVRHIGTSQRAADLRSNPIPKKVHTPTKAAVVPGSEETTSCGRVSSAVRVARNPGPDVG